MIINSTISTLQQHHHHHFIDEPTAIAEIAPTDYNPAGAALFIIVVLLWYSLGIVCMLGMQIRARADTIEDCTRRRAKLFIRTLRDQTQRKQILEELGDKKKRDKLWNIYLGKIDNNDEKLARAETGRIRNIQKQLAVLNRTQMIMNDTFTSPHVKHSIRHTSSNFHSTIIPDISEIENSPGVRRRTSLDQQIIERWKSLVDQSKAHEQLPWPIRKLMIHRHFRRVYKNSVKDSEQTYHEHIDDDEQCQLIPSPGQPQNDLRRVTMKTNEQLNPYITYFHLPLNEHFQSNIQNLPLVRVSSNHHIIQMNHDESHC